MILIIIGAIVFFFIPFIKIIGMGLALIGIIVIKSGDSFSKGSLELSKYLENSGLKTWINTIVIFPNPEVQLKVYSPKVNVICLDELYSHMNAQRNVLNPGICNEIVDCLLKLVPQNLREDAIE